MKIRQFPNNTIWEFKEYQTSLLDRFAEIAMQSIIIGQWIAYKDAPEQIWSYEAIAKESYRLAVEMIKEREKHHE